MRFFYLNYFLAMKDTFSEGYSNANFPIGKWKYLELGYKYSRIWDLLVCACILNHFQLFATPWTVALRDSLSMEFSRQEYWSGLTFIHNFFYSQMCVCVCVCVCVRVCVCVQCSMVGQGSGGEQLL